MWEDRISRNNNSKSGNIQKLDKGDAQGIGDSKPAAGVSVNLRPEKRIGWPVWLRTEVGSLDKDSK